jgi:hypothetical protein
MDRLLERARTEGTPLIEGEAVTFIWQGEQAPYLIADFLDWEADPRPLERLAEQVWVYSTTLRQDAYIEYAISSGRPACPIRSKTRAGGGSWEPL